MTSGEFVAFIDSNDPHVEWSEDEEKFYFRDLRYAWYANNPGNCTEVLKTKMQDMTVQDLKDAIVKGLKVEQITRVTGYFARINAWNPGKTGELKDRHKSGDLTTLRRAQDAADVVQCPMVTTLDLGEKA
jgi:hypothetical protein